MIFHLKFYLDKLRISIKVSINASEFSIYGIKSKYNGEKNIFAKMLFAFFFFRKE